MSKTNSLTLLVNSLTKGEKRYFKLYSALQDGQKDYLCLFELIEKGNSTEDAKKLFKQAKPEASFEATGKYLYKIITDCLVHVRIEQNKTARLVIALLKANILFEKSLYDQGFKQLKNIRASAETYEQHFIQLWAAKSELYYLSNLNFYAITEAELIQKQLKIEELLRQQRHINQHSALYELLRHRLLFKGTVRTKQQKDELNDLVVSEMSFTTTPLAETFESYKTHLLFQSHYFITISDYKSALQTFYELNKLFEDNQYLWVDSPLDYLSSIEGILDSLHTIRRYDEMDFFIDKLQQLQKVSVYFNVMVQRVTFIYKTAAFIYGGEFDKAIGLKEAFEESLFKKMQLLDLSKQAEVYLYTALIFIGSGNMNKAHYYLNRILLESKLYYTLPVYRTFRLIHLLVHYELGNHDYIEYETRSIKRSLNGNTQKTYLLENIVFKFVQQVLPAGNKERIALWDKISNKFDLIQTDEFEIQILKIFDFALWIKARLCRQSFSQLLKDKSVSNKP